MDAVVTILVQWMLVCNPLPGSCDIIMRYVAMIDNILP